MNEYILTVSDFEKAELLNVLKNFTSIRLRRVIDETIPPEVEAFIESTVEGLKQVELHEKGEIQLMTGDEFLKELDKIIETEHAHAI